MNSKKVFSNLIWRFFERVGAKLISVVVQLVLARILAPDDFGVVAIVVVITDILQVFVESGFGTALIQKKDADDLDFSSVFLFNMAACVILYVALFFCAPLLSVIYKNSSLTKIFRVVGIILIISGVRNVQQAYVSKHMLFKKFFFATLGGQICAAVIGITMALKGFGVWAYVAQYLINNFIGTVILWLIVSWRPKLEFSFERLKGLFSFGWKLLVSSLLNTISDKLRPLIIGVKYTTSDLAFYNEGIIFPNLIVENINTSIDSVLLPAMSGEQDSRDRVKAMTRRSIKVASFIMWPMMVGLLVCARPLVSLILTDKWLGCVFFIQVFCLYYAMFPIHTANLNAIKAIGRSDIFLKLEIIKKVLDLAVVIGTLFLGVKAMAVGLLAEGVINLAINSYPNSRLIGYGFMEQIRDFAPSFLLSLAMGAVIYPLSFLKIPDILLLVLQVIGGVAVYILLAKLFKIETFSYILNLVKRLIKHEEN